MNTHDILNLIQGICGLISLVGLCITIKFAIDSRRYRRQTEAALERIKRIRQDQEAE